MALCLPFAGLAQYTMTSGDHSLEISGVFATYYNHRILKPGVTDHDKDRFGLRDASIQLEGRHGRKLEYELQMDFADLASSNAGAFDPENPGLMDAWVRYKGLSWFDITFGYGKVPFSRASLTPNKFSPYWQRAEISRGGFFARRDVGLTLQRDFLRERLVVMAGAYTGLGETSLKGDNDASGRPEVVARAEMSWPAKGRYREMDFRHTPTPILSVGANGRYTHRELPDGKAFPAGALGEYGIKMVEGEKLGVGVDGMLWWKGFTLSAEGHLNQLTPSDPFNSNLQSLPDSLTGGYFRTGGYYAQASYCFRKPALVLSARWEEYNLNDLVHGVTQKLHGAIAYRLTNSGSSLKLHYVHVLSEESLDPLDWTDQVRIGCQFSF